MPEHLTNVSESGSWPTPVASDYHARRPSKNWVGDSDLVSVVWRRNGGAENPEKRPAKLNAPWVEWLMGWPIGWTDCDASATAKCQAWFVSHGGLCPTAEKAAA